MGSIPSKYRSSVLRRTIGWARDNPAILLALCVGFLAGVIFLMPVLPYHLPDSTAAIVGSAIGAAVAVFGAIVITDYRERVQRRQLVAILIGGIKDLYEAADELDTALHNSRGVNIATALLPVLSRWQHLAAFSPYRELGDFELINAMAEIDVLCRQLIPLSEPEPPPQSHVMMGWATRLFADRQSRASALVQKLMIACRDASVALRR